MNKTIFNWPCWFGDNSMSPVSEIWKNESSANDLFIVASSSLSCALICPAESAFVRIWWTGDTGSLELSLFLDPFSFPFHDDRIFIFLSKKPAMPCGPRCNRWKLLANNNNCVSVLQYPYRSGCRYISKNFVPCFQLVILYSSWSYLSITCFHLMSINLHVVSVSRHNKAFI